MIKRTLFCFICGNEIGEENSMEVSGPITSYTYYKVQLCEECWKVPANIKEAKLYTMGQGPKCIRVDISGL